MDPALRFLKVDRDVPAKETRADNAGRVVPRPALRCVADGVLVCVVVPRGVVGVEQIADVEAGKFAPLMKDVTFSLDEFHKNIDGCNRKLDEVLHGH